MKDLLISAKSLPELKGLIRLRPHAVMVLGAKGAGKKSVSMNLAAGFLGIRLDELSKHPYFHIFSPVKNSISISQIRELQEKLRLRTTGKSKIRRVILLVDAHYMSAEAQNAILKILEEPPADTCIILTIDGEMSLRPTIYSRVQRLRLVPPDLPEAISYFEQHGHGLTDIKRAYKLSDGRVGLLSNLLDRSDGHPYVSAINLAKSLLSNSTYNRLIQIDYLAKDKEALPRVLFALKRVVYTALQGAAAKSSNNDINRLRESLKAIYLAEASLSYSPNTKLLLTNLFLRI